MTKKIAIIGTVGLPANYGGFETLTEYLTKHFATSFDVRVYCSSKSYPIKLKTYNNATLKYLPFHANGVQSILYDSVSIFNALWYVDVLLILGVSGCIVLPFVKLISTKKIIVNIDGLEWKRSKWGKAAKWFLKYSEKLAVKHADVVISDNKVIQKHVWDNYQVKSELIAYGADHCKKEVLTEKVLKEYSFLAKNYAFNVCRIEPENNVLLILQAFSLCPSLAIVIVGNWDNSAYGKALKQQFEQFKNIHIVNPIYDQSILNEIRSNCQVYIHGHSAGGTNPSLVEAMYLELPVIAYGVSYNKETTDNKALFFDTKLQLVEILTNLKQQELYSIAQQLKKIADTKYIWTVIAAQYAKLF